MKIIFAVLLTALSNLALSAQTNRPSISVSTKQEQSPKQNQQPNAQHELVILPTAKRKFRPKITLQRALKLAERYIEKEKIDVSSFHLHQVRYILYGNENNQQPAWHLWWVNEDGALGSYVEIVVIIDAGSVSRLPSM